MVERLISDEEKGKKETRATCKAAMEEVNKSDENFPIVLDKMTSRQYFSDTSYGGVRIYLTHMYRMSGNMMDGELIKELSQFMLGMKIVVTSKKRESGASLDEGKNAMRFEVYKRLCEEMYNGKCDEHLFSHDFLTLE